MSLNSDKTKEAKRLLTIFFYKYFRFLIVLAALAVLFAGNAFFIGPKREKISLSRIEAIGKRQEEAEKLKKYLSDLDNYRQEYDKIDFSSRERLKKFLPENPDKEKLYLEIEKIFKAAGAEVAGITIKEAVAATAQSSRAKGGAEVPARLPEAVKSLSIQVDLGSELDYAAFKRLLGQIEKNLRLLDVVNLGYDNESGIVTMLLETYYIN